MAGFIFLIIGALVIAWFITKVSEDNVMMREREYSHYYIIGQDDHGVILEGGRKLYACDPALISGSVGDMVRISEGCLHFLEDIPYKVPEGSPGTKEFKVDEAEEIAEILKTSGYEIETTGYICACGATSTDQDVGGWCPICGTDLRYFGDLYFIIKGGKRIYL